MATVDELNTQARKEFDQMVAKATPEQLEGIKLTINWLKNNRSAGYRRMLTEKHNGVFTHPKM